MPAVHGANAPVCGVRRGRGLRPVYRMAHGISDNGLCSILGGGPPIVSGLRHGGAVEARMLDNLIQHQGG